MRDRIHTYHFGRLSILGASSSDRQKFIMEAFDAPVSAKSGQFRYRVMSESVLEYRQHKFAYGELVKYKQLLEGEVVDEELDKILESGLPQGVVHRKLNFPIKPCSR